ncbi:MAG: ion channel [Victivallaceae bacterium]|nr:ion channel [Victivallaceae bacterium]
MYILFLSLLVMVNLGFEYLIPRQYDEVLSIIRWTDDFICASFFIDVVWRFCASEKRWRFFLRIGWIDLLASIPHFHFLRIGKFVYVFSIVRDIRSAGRLFQFLFASKVSITLLFSFLVFVASIIIAALSVLYFEKNVPHATIVTAGDAMWWALNLASTCGNTICVPITLPGRVIGGILIVIGYGLFSMNAGVLSGWFLRNLATVEKAKATREGLSPATDEESTSEQPRETGDHSP